MFFFFKLQNKVATTFDGQITLSDAVFLTDYNDPNSAAYKALVMDLQNEIIKALSANADEEIIVITIELQ